VSISRYTRTTSIRDPKSGKLFRPSSRAVQRIRRAVDNGDLRTTVSTISQGQRLDVLAYQVYGDATAWWIIAAASGIGWACQVPPGVVLKIPTDIEAIFALVG